MSENPPREISKVRVARTAREQEAEQLLSEVRELFEQYQREVPRKRKPWPESIRGRVRALWELGVSSHQISLEANVPAQTLYSWRKRIKSGREPEFTQLMVTRSPRRSNFEIQVDEERRRALLQPSQLKSTSEERRTSLSTVTIVLTTGIRVEGLDVVAAAELLRRLS